MDNKRAQKNIGHTPTHTHLSAFVHESVSLMFLERGIQSDCGLTCQALSRGVYAHTCAHTYSRSCPHTYICLITSVHQVH